VEQPANLAIDEIEKLTSYFLFCFLFYFLFHIILYHLISIPVYFHFSIVFPWVIPQKQSTIETLLLQTSPSLFQMRFFIQSYSIW